jgi:hypothetical protein
MLLYVEDMLIAGKSMKEIVALKSQFSSEFDMKDLVWQRKSLVWKYLGIVSLGYYI